MNFEKLNSMIRYLLIRDFRTLTFFVIVLSVFNIFISCRTEIDPHYADLLIKNATIVDVENGSVQSAMNILVLDGKIMTVTKGLPSSLAHDTLNAKDSYVIPGLWDMHVHTGTREIFFPLYLTHGILGVRDMGGDLEYGTGNFSISLDSLAVWRTKIQNGDILGPRLIITGPIIDGPKPRWPVLGYPVHTEKETRDLVRSIVARGADFIKVYETLPRELYKAIADESSKQRIPFLGHVPKALTAIEAVKLGQKSIEHMSEIIGKYNEDSVKELFGVLKNNKSWQTPTLAVYRDLKRKNESKFLDDPRLKYIPLYIKDIWAKSTWWHNPRSNSDKVQQLEEWNSRLAMVKQMHDAGVLLLAGSDAANPYTYPGSGLHDELEELVSAGLTPLEALRLATLAPAKYLQAEDSLGSVKPGKVADMVLLSGNPIEDIQNIRHVEAVVVRGRVLNRSDLDDMLTVLDNQTN